MVKMPVNTQETPLHYLQPLLEHVDFQTELLPEDDQDQAYEQLLAVVGQDNHGRELVVQMTYINDILRAAARQGQLEQEEDPAYVLLFALQLPVEIPAEKLAETAFLALVCNRFLPIGTWVAGPQDGLSLKYSLVREEPDMHGRVVVEVLEKLAWAAQKMAPWVDKLLAGPWALSALEAEVSQAFGQGETLQ